MSSNRILERLLFGPEAAISRTEIHIRQPADDSLGGRHATQVAGAWEPALSCKGRRWDKCETARDAQVLQKALQKIRAMRAEFWVNVNVLGDGAEFNQALEHAGRVAERRSLRASITATSLDGSTPAQMHGRTLSRSRSVSNM